jgi:hypothetical protein
MISSRVNVFDRFPEITAEIDAMVVRALDAAAEEAQRVAVEIGSERKLTDIEILPARGQVDGFAAGIKGRYYYRFQSFGTLGRAIRPKRPGTVRSHAPGTGIEPNRMFQKARTAGRRRLIETLVRHV